MSSTTSNSGDDGDTGSIEHRIVDVLADRFTRNVAVNPEEQFAAVLFGRQYNQETAKEIAREEVEPVLGNEWTVDGIPAPKTDVDVADPVTYCGLRVIPIESRKIGGIDIYPHTIGLIAGGLNAYLQDRLVERHEIPPTYGQWDDKFPTIDVGRNDNTVFEGPVGEARDADEAMRLCYKSEYVRAGVRIITGGGRYQADEFTFYEAVPFGVLEHPASSIVIAPIISHPDLDEIRRPDFVYSSKGDGYGFHLLK